LVETDPQDGADPTPEGARGALSTLLAELAHAPPSELGSAWDRWLRPGVTVARFELLREIGRGGFGIVWEARDTRNGNVVAFKALRAGGGASAREERLLREAELASRLSHPNVVALHEAGRTEHGPYLVLERLRGETLAERLEAGAIPPREVLRICVAVARAVAHAHAHGVVHRDLKPANVFLCEDGGVKVLDFGLAHAFGQRRVGGGTPAYMAPEQWRGAPEDERTDVFALGVILFRTLAGALPFSEAAGSAAPGAYPVAAIDVPDDPPLGLLVGRMIDEDPVQRPRDGEEVLAALEGHLAGIERSPWKGPVRLRPPARRTAAGEPGARPPAADVRAQEYCLRGRQFLQQTRKASLLFAREMFARAIRVDPGYALAHAGVAEAIALLHLYYPPDEAQLAEADAASLRALDLGPELAEAHAARGVTLFLMKRGAEARRELERAVELDPGLSEAYYYAARTAFQDGRLEDAAHLFREAARARESYQASFFAAQTSEALGRREEALAAYGEALRVVERHMDLNPDDPRAATMRAVALCRLGRREEGLRWAQQALSIDPQDAGVRYNVACLYALEGAKDDALACLEQVVRAGFGSVDWFRRDPDLASLRGDPRFEALMAGL
jgi:tetratricopeptide (TPR) repeat protein